MSLAPSYDVFSRYPSENLNIVCSLVLADRLQWYILFCGDHSLWQKQHCTFVGWHMLRAHSNGNVVLVIVTLLCHLHMCSTSVSCSSLVFLKQTVDHTLWLITCSTCM